MSFIHFIQYWSWEAVKFLVVGVGISYIGRKAVGDYIIHHSKRWIEATERNAAIWQHYVSGHETDSVLDCHTGKCRVFTEYAS